MSEQYKTAAHNFIEKGLNQKNLAAFDEYFSPKLTDHALPPGVPAGLEGRKMFASALLAPFPISMLISKIWSPMATNLSLTMQCMVHTMVN